MSVQEALRQMRLELGITQTDLARKLNKSFLTVNRWENGKGFPSRDNAKSILETARDGQVSEECYAYLCETLMPDVKRGRSAASYGFPDIDREFLFQLADGSANSVYVIEAGTYNLLYANRKAESSAVRYLLERGENLSDRRLLFQTDKRCFHYFGGLSSPCPFCPLAEFTRDGYTDRVVTIPETKRMLHVHARLVNMKKGMAYAIYLTDLTEKDAEIHALYELTDDIPGGVGIYNVYSEGRIELVFMNKALLRMLGEKRRDELLKGEGSDLCLIHPEDRARLWEEIESSLLEKRPVDIRLRMRIINGRYHLLHLHGKPIKKDAEKNTFYCQFHDLEQPLE